MQRPRFKRHSDDRKWQNPINSMTESSTSNMLSSAFFPSSLGLSGSPCFPFCLSLRSYTVYGPLPSCFSPPFFSQFVVCGSVSLFLNLLSSFLSFFPPSFSFTHSLCICVFICLSHHFASLLKFL